MLLIFGQALALVATCFAIAGGVIWIFARIIRGRPTNNRVSEAWLMEHGYQRKGGDE